jgi:hypothetical protein
MTRLELAIVLAGLFGTASGAWGQSGLAGAPDMLRLPNVDRQSTEAAPIPVPQAADAAQPEESAYPHRLTQAEAVIPPPLNLPADPSSAASPADAGAAPPPAVLHHPNTTRQMLEEAAPARPLATPDPALTAGRDFGRCGDDALCPWYTSLNGLVMTRDQANRVWTTFQTGSPATRFLNTADAEVDWSGGYEFRLGRRFASGLWAIEVDYWGVDGLDGFRDQLAPEGQSLSTPLDVSGIDFGGVPGTLYFNAAEQHRLVRRNDVDSVELNLVRAHLATESSALDLNAFAGIRYFRFFEDLSFGSRTFAGPFGGDPLDEAFLRDRIENHLLGVQFGLRGDYNVGCGVSLFATPKLGLFGNHIKNQFSAYRGDGLPAELTPAATDFTGTYPVSAAKDGFSFVGEIDAGLAWRFHPRWTATLGYRLFAATGIGLADAQFAPQIADTPSLADIQRNGHLLLHGGFAGISADF